MKRNQIILNDSGSVISSIPNDRRERSLQESLRPHTSVTSEITKRYYVRRYVIATSVESLEYPTSLLSPPNSRSRKKSYLVLILDQGKTIIFGRLSRRLESIPSEMRGHGRCAPNSRLSTNEIISSRRSTPANSKRNAKVERSIDSFSTVPRRGSLVILKAPPSNARLALRYITTSLHLINAFVEEKKNAHTRNISRVALHLGQRINVCFCVQFCQIAMSFLWICLITLRAPRWDELNFYSKSIHVIKILITKIAERVFRFVRAKSNHLKLLKRNTLIIMRYCIKLLLNLHKNIK